MRAIIDVLAGEAAIGGLRVPIAEAGRDGELAVGGPGGTVLRPIRFGERARIVDRAAATERPADGVAAGILGAATVHAGSGEVPLLEIVALVLAGAERAGPSFDETVLRVARSTGWVYAGIRDAEASEVDRLAGPAEDWADETGGWTRLLFAPSPSDDVSAIRDELAENLLRRTETVRTITEDADPLARDGDAASGGRSEVPTGRSFGPDLRPGQPGSRIEQSAMPESLPFRFKSALAGAGRPEPDGARPGRPASQQFSTRHLAALTAAAVDPSARPEQGCASVPAVADPTALALASPEPVARPAPTTGRLPSRRSPSEPWLLPEPAWGLRARRPVAAGPATASENVAASILADPASVGIRPGPEAANQATSPIATMIEVATDPADLADRIARLLDDEADLRGLDR